jgi:hypothetical protein
MLTSSSFILFPGALTGNAAGDAMYVFQLAVTDGKTRVSVTDTVAFTLGGRPVPGSLALLGPSSGIALVTAFMLNASDWTAASALDQPLSYAFGYSSNGAAPVFLTPFQSTSESWFSASIYLPSGSLTLSVFVATARGALANASLSLSVIVDSAPPLGVAAAVNLAIALQLADQPIAALQLASSIATELNNNPASALGFCQRGDLLSDVIAAFLSSADGAALLASSARDASTLSLLSLVAHTLAALSAVPGELHSDAQAAALFSATALAGSAVIAAVQGPLFSAPQDLVTTLSAVSQAAGSSPATLQRIDSALSSLASHVVATLSAPGEQAVQLHSSNIQMQLSLDYASPVSTARLFDSGVSSGLQSASFFGPFSGSLPASASCSSDCAVQTVYIFTGFDAHTGVFSPPFAASGVSRLALSYRHGGPINVQGLGQPLNISLRPAAVQASRTASEATHAVCAFWSNGVYATDGSLGLPSPLPRGVTASFNASAYAAQPAAASESFKLLSTLHLAGGPLRGCTATILDCPYVGAAGAAWMDPADPFSQSTIVRCLDANSTMIGLGGLASSAGPPALLVFTGTACKLWRPGNSEQCWWSAYSQSFTGSGCVARAPTPATPTCLSVHLTDYSELAVNSSLHLSNAEQLSAPPQPLAAAKLAILLGIVLALFACMLLCAAVASASDRRRARRLLDEIFEPPHYLERGRFGFRRFAVDGTVWTWSLVPQRLGRDLSTDPLGRLAHFVGLPAGRLKAAIPEELIAFWRGTDVEEEQSVISSTALAFALLRVLSLVSIEELEQQQAVAGAHFAHARAKVHTPDFSSNVEFDSLVSLFVDLLAGSSLSAPSGWVQAARLWRVILLRHRDRGVAAGGWEPSHGLATALYAHEVMPDAPSARFGVPGYWDSASPESPYSRAFFERCAAEEVSSRRANEAGVALDFVREWPQEPHDMAGPDDFQERAIASCMPDILQDAFACGDGRIALSVWTTCLCVALLERLRCSWAVSGTGAPEKTLLDDADGWLARAALEQSQRLFTPGSTRSDALLSEDVALSADGAIQAARVAAEEQLVCWERAREVRIAFLRAKCAVFPAMGHQQPGSSIAGAGRRVAVDVLRSLRTQHPASTALAPPLSPLSCAQHVLLLFTRLLCLLAVATFFFSTRATHCCSSLRQLVGCDADASQPCRSYAGDCVAMQGLFSGLVIPGLDHSPSWSPLPQAVAAWRCQEGFPGLHRAPPFAQDLIIGTIAAALATALNALLEALPRISCEPPVSRQWLSASPLQLWLGAPEFGSFWRSGALASTRSLLLRMSARNSPSPLRRAAAAAASACTSAMLRFSLLASLGPAAMDAIAGRKAAPLRSALRAVLVEAKRRQVAGWLGAALLCLAWAVLTWLVLWLGLGVASKLGIAAQKDVARAWAVAVLVDAVVQSWAVLFALLGSIWRHCVLAWAWWMPQEEWLELFVDAGRAG